MKETLCENCLDVSSFDEILYNGLCLDCCAEVNYQVQHFGN